MYIVPLFNLYSMPYLDIYQFSLDLGKKSILMFKMLFQLY